MRLNDPLASVPFNLEIDFEGGDLVVVARDLYGEGLIAEPRQGLYGEGRGTNYGRLLQVLIKR